MAVSGSHVAGGSIGALIAYISARYGWHVSPDEALTFAGAFAGVGGAIVHLFQPPGLIPRVKAALGAGDSK